MSLLDHFAVVSSVKFAGIEFTLARTAARARRFLPPSEAGRLNIFQTEPHAFGSRAPLHPCGQRDN
jgi:hypothetical protein